MDSPPTRRELTLLLFALTVFVLSYNLETSLQLVGVNPSQLSSGYLSTIGLGTKDPGFEADGRRPKEWRDPFENLIFGEWQWDAARSLASSAGRLALAPRPRPCTMSAREGLQAGVRGRTTAGSAWWAGSPRTNSLCSGRAGAPVASAVAHVPGFTILDNVVVLTGRSFGVG
ncbi:hypothetical protein B0H21DRAFT_37354 [Amylocystis lapponica]|nr:hypothetical protein B0H21DRAFT_37354 [Amylocystis lapponica]